LFFTNKNTIEKTFFRAEIEFGLCFRFDNSCVSQIQASASEQELSLRAGVENAFMLDMGIIANE